MPNYLKLIICLVASFGAAAIGGYATSLSLSDWYLTLNKPSFNPPSWLFGPVWTVLYTMIAIAGYLVWKEGDNKFGVKVAMALFFTQLALNALWSWAFFGWQSPGWASIEIVVLWICILLMIINFYRVKKLAAYLLIPYLLWVSFAAMLTISIWWLN